jgi:hypothetical protein
MADFTPQICVEPKYLETLAGWSKLISSEITVTVTDGPQGKKLAQLKQWLWQDKISQEENKTSSIQVSGSACLRGIELQMTSDEAVERIKTFLSKEKDRDGSERFRNWYVNIDGQRVAVKWMVSKLTGLSVSDFTTGEAKRVLAQLGVNIESIVK